jgi:hypothetical protein
MPSRRRVLHGVCSAAVLASAGCLSLQNERQSTPLEVRRIDAGRYRRVPAAPRDWMPDADLEPFAGLGVGTERVDGDDPPHCVWVWNVSGDARELTVTLATGSETVFSRSFDAAASACVGVVLFTSDGYTVEVSGPKSTAAVGVDRSWFDCNASATDVGLVEPGRIEYATVSQAAGCE